MCHVYTNLVCHVYKCLCVCICMHVNYDCMYSFIHTHTHIYIYIHTCVCLYISMCHVYTDLVCHVYKRLRVCVYSCICIMIVYMHLHIYIYTCMYTHHTYHTQIDMYIHSRRFWKRRNVITTFLKKTQCWTHIYCQYCVIFNDVENDAILKMHCLILCVCVCVFFYFHYCVLFNNVAMNLRRFQHFGHFWCRASLDRTALWPLVIFSLHVMCCSLL